MKQWLAIIPFVAALPVIAESGPAPLTPAQRQILAIERRWATAEDKHDEGTLRRILDDKFVATFGAEAPYDKEAFVKSQLKGEIDPTQSQTLDEKAIVVGDTAVVVGEDEQRGTRNGKRYSERARYTVTYTRRNGRWVALAEHLAEIPPTR